MRRNNRQTLPRAHAGKRGENVRSDCYVSLALKQSGGVKMEIQSKVASMYGESLRAQAGAMIERARIAHAEVLIEDFGALPFTLAARLETAIRRLFNHGGFEYPANERGIPPSATRKDRLRRTRLYLPGNEPKFFINAGLHQPDAVILDLEDSVAPEEKDAARILVQHALCNVDFHGCEIMVRINAGEMGRQDVRALARYGVQVVLIPKCESASAVAAVAREIESLRRRHRLTHDIFLIPIIESALGVVKAFEIATASEKVCGLALGLEDYTADLGVPRTPGETESFFAKSAIINAARAAGVQALASVYSDIENAEGLRQNARAAKALGFEGMGCIHPRQIKIIHEVFAPAAEEIKQAMQIVLAFEQALKNGAGVIALGAKMIDMPVVKRAQATLDHALLLGRISPDWRGRGEQG